MFRRGLRAWFPSLSRGLQTEAAFESEQHAVPRRRQQWPLDHRGEEIRTAKARKMGITTSTQKLNMVAKLVRGMTIKEAERQMVGCRKKHAEDVWRTIAAAVTNARFFGLREDRLIVHEAFVGKGKYIKRIRPWHGKGRYGIEHKKYAHLTILVRELDEELWEASVMPKYVHLPFRERTGEFEDDRNHLIHQSDRVSFHSQLDLSLKNTKEKIEGLRTLLKEDYKESTSDGSQTCPK